MKTLKIIIILLVAFNMANCSKSADNKNSNEKTIEVVEVTQTELSLYDRLGGAEGISSIVDDIIATHMANPVISAKFSHLKNNPEHLMVFQQNVKDFLGAGTGGPEKYTGKNMLDAHKGLQTTSTEFLSTIDDIMNVLSQHNIDDQTKKDMLYIVFSFKDQIIGG
jgi:hemoglobin